MVSFWPWQRNDSSTASFEKTLSSLSAKITTTQARLDGARSSSRRIKVLATLYLSFAYLVYAIVSLLVVGYQNMGVYEWTGMASGPVLIYAVRTAVTGYYNLRVDSISKRLKEQQTERNSTIQKLKAATKYDSTMELIEKYGGEGRIKKGEGDDGEQAAGKGRGKPGSKDANRTMPERTQFAPPATANIQRRPLPNANDPRRQQAHRMEPSAEFAPNAGLVSPASPPTSQQLRSTSNDNTISRQHTLSRQHSALSVTSPETHWYDRIFDVLLGEDETAAKNRIILLCGSCRLVNGQAPPGTKSLVEVGMWRCMRCGASNGEESETEGQRIVKEVLSGKGLAEETSRQTDLGHRNGASQSESDDELHEGSDSSDVNPVEGNGEAVAAVGEDAAAGVKRRRPRNP